MAAPADDDVVWIVQLYRALTQRSVMWRHRLDVTINWAAPLLLAVCTLALGEPAVPHLLLLGLGLGVIAIALAVEARRYRLLHHEVWRVSLMEVGYFAARLAGTTMTTDWRALLANDLYRPRLLVSLWTAVRTRLRSTYLVFGFLLLIAWVAKVAIHPRPVASPAELIARMAIGGVEGWIVASAVALATMAASFVAAFARSTEELEHWTTDAAFRDYAHRVARGELDRDALTRGERDPRA